jgi:DNA-binding MarR family transcriptional regulator
LVDEQGGNGMQRDTCGILIKKIHDAAGKRINNSLREKDLTLTQARILFELGNDSKGIMPLKELERRFNVAQSTIVGVIRRLEAKGFVQGSIDPKDNRVKLVKLTPEGEKFREMTIDEIEKMEKRLLAHLTKTEQRDFLRFLHTVHDNIK